MIKKNYFNLTRSKNFLFILSLFVVVAFLISPCFGIVASADDSVEVYVTISNGEIVLPLENVVAKDEDNDGKITINDALIKAHKLKFNGDGYEYSMGIYGLKIDKLWGVENGDGYGYYKNNNSAFSLGDEIKNGDSIYAFVYKDTVMFSDQFTYFEEGVIKSEPNQKISLKAFALGYDSNWNTVSKPLENLMLTVDGRETNIFTDNNGVASISFDKEGTYIISGRSQGSTIAPPICKIIISDVNNETLPAVPGDNNTIFLFVFISIISFVLLKMLLTYEK